MYTAGSSRANVTNAKNVNEKPNNEFEFEFFTIFSHPDSKANEFTEDTKKIIFRIGKVCNTAV
jgi:hypothetical protein